MPYTSRSTATITVDIQKDGGAEDGTETWTVDASAPFDSSDFTEGGTGDEGTGLTGPIYDGREYEITFDAESGYNTPTASNITAQNGTPQEFVGNYIAEATVVWQDTVQSPGISPWGFSDTYTSYPTDNYVPPDDANGCNISRVEDPLDPGSGNYCLRFYNEFDIGSRGQNALWNINQEYNDLVYSGDPVFFKCEMLFPSAGGSWETGIYTGNHWISLFDMHSHGGGAAWWHTSPGIMVNQFGNMTVRFEWGGGSEAYNSYSGWSSSAMPVGSWFDFEFEWQWTTSGGACRLWFDEVQVIEQTGLVTRLAAHDAIDTYWKQYGIGAPPNEWDPTPTIRYMRNFSVSGSRSF